MDRIIMHVDMDAFFASIEQAQKPWLRGKPIAVSGNPNGRSVIATASYEARVYGIKSGMPLSKARALYPNLIVIKGNVVEYERISNELYNIFLKFAPQVEKFSIDEVFMELTYLVKSFDEAYQVGKKIKSIIKDGFGISCTIGISMNKLLSKVVAKLAKPDGLIILRRDDVDNVLQNLDVGEITGIGKKTQLLLKEKFGVEKIRDLQKIPLSDLITIFHSYGNFLYESCRGIDDSPVITATDREDAKSVGNSVTFDSDTDNIIYIKAILRMLSSHVALRLRNVGFSCQTLTLTVRYDDFYTTTHRKPINVTSNDEDIYKESLNLFHEVYNGSKVRLLGVSASKLTSSQMNNGLFTEEHLNKEKHLLEAMDSSRRRFGFKIAEYGNVSLLHKEFLLTDKKISGA